MLKKEIHNYFGKVEMREISVWKGVPTFSPDSGNYIRLFSPHVIKKKGEVRLLGVFGVVFLPFEKLWGREHAAVTLMVSLYASNLHFLMSPPDMISASEDVKYGWFQRIRMGIDLFPSSFSEFLAGLSGGEKLGAFPLETVIGDRAKVDAFLQWSRDWEIRNTG